VFEQQVDFRDETLAIGKSGIDLRPHADSICSAAESPAFREHPTTLRALGADGCLSLERELSFARRQYDYAGVIAQPAAPAEVSAGDTRDRGS
jgi:hypothetical protein